MWNPKELEKWYQDHYDLILDDFKTFLKFPSISTDPQYEPQAKACAQFLLSYLKEIGMQVDLWETPGLPVVFASYLEAGPKRPTLLFYHHYDVQPVDPLDLWKSDPFDPVIRGGNIYARGAVDNKGQCFYSVTAMKALLELGKKLNVNIKMFIEGEEESGGKGTAAILLSKQKELKADHLLVIDFDIPSKKTPAITLGMRGLVCWDIECINASTDLHSGVHGGIAMNPNRALCSVLAQLWDETGKVTLPGFYEDVKPLSKEHLARLDMSFDLEAYVKSFGVKAFANETAQSLKESNWLRPSLEINGLYGGYAGPGFKTVLPAKSSAKISCRLVPGQDPEKIWRSLVQFFEERLPKGMKVKVDLYSGAPAFRSSFDSPIVKTAALAYEEIFGSPCHYLLCGATVPIIVDLAKVSGAEVAMMGMGLAEDDIHAPNEHFGLDRFKLGFLTVCKIVEKLSV